MLNPIGLALDTRYGYRVGLRDDLVLNIMSSRLSGSWERVLAWRVAATAPAGISDDEKHRALAKLCWRVESEGLVAVPYREGLLAVGKNIPWPIPDPPYPLQSPERVSLASPEMGAGMERLLQRILFREARALGYSKYRRTFVKAGAFVRTASAAGLPVEVNREAFEARVFVQGGAPYLLLDLAAAMRQPLLLTIAHLLGRGLTEEQVSKTLVGREVVAEHYSLGGVITGVRWIPVAECIIEDRKQSLVDYWAALGEELDPSERPVIDVVLKRTKKTATYPSSQLNLSLRGVKIRREERLQTPPEKRMTGIQNHPLLRRPLRLDGVDVRFDPAPLSIARLIELGLALDSGVAAVPTLEFGGGFTSPDARTLLGRGPAGGKENLHVVYVAEKDVPVEALHEALAGYYEGWGFGKLQLDEVIPVAPGGKKSYYRAGQAAAEKVHRRPENAVILGVIDGSTESYRAVKKGVDAAMKRSFAAVQILRRGTAMDIIAGKQWLAADLLPQVYAKSTKKPAWLLSKPAGGTSGNAYLAFDVSRRLSFELDVEEGVASAISKEASAIASLCDEHGRIITWDTYASHTGELLGKQEAWDILTAAFDNIHRASGDAFRRLVVYKDGPLRDAERSFITASAEEVRADYRRETGVDVQVDLVAVPKTGIERLFQRRGQDFGNPERGTYVLLPDNRALLVSSAPKFGTADPLHVNYEAAVGGSPTSMKVLVSEFFDLTNLDWRSVYQQPKTPLPLQLVQSLGELLTLDIESPSYIPL